jgi:gliding motility-associated-like protein
MKKCLLLAALLILTQLNNLLAQTLFSGPDTVCVNQPVTLRTNILNAQSYYWGFCSGSENEIPTWVPPIGTNLGNNFGFHIPSNIDIIEDSGSYYGFALNSETTEFIRLNFGNSLNNVPTVTNFGNLTHGIPINPTSLYILRDTFSQNWFIFISGGFTKATSQLARVDFGHHLSNPAPNIANFGNYANVLDGPKGIFVAQDANNNWYGYIVNHNTNELIHLDFSFNVSNTPLMASYGNSYNLSFPTDLAAIQDNGKWYLFVTNEGDNTITRLDLGTGFDTAAAAINSTKIGTNTTPPSTSFNFRINSPSAISVNRDCGNLYLYVTDSISAQFIGIQMTAAVGPYSAVDYNNVGAMNQPSGLSNIIREGDNLYGFITNAGDSTLTRVVFQQCTNASIPSFSEVQPPAYSYDTAGVYNIYFVVNQGLPSMQVECKTITVIPPPPMYSNNDTSICEGDTIKLHVVSDEADSIRWTSTYNIDTTYLYRDSVKVYPDYSTGYHVTLYYPFGCILDTTIRVNVIKVVADAGPDRWIADGASTIIGGPNTTENALYLYQWTPFQYLSDSTIPNPVASPPNDFTYYLTVTTLDGEYQCTSKDTMVVHVTCADLAVPNAFSPASASPLTNKFGLLNKEIAKLNYFRVFDRWGVLVFETADPLQGWDGNFNGKPEPSDVYVWEADAFCTSGKEIKKSGNVTLLR